MGAENEGKVKEFVEFSYVGGQPRANRKASQKKGENNEKNKKPFVKPVLIFFGQMNEIVMQSCGGDGNQHRHRHRNRNGADVFPGWD